MKSTLKRTWAEINLDNLTYNFEAIRRTVAPGTKLLGVVKADAYGHGAVLVAKHLEAIGASFLAVSNIDECEELRFSGVHLPILMLGYTPSDQAERILRLDMTQSLQDINIARAFSNAAVASGKQMRVHIKLDTGMSRLGFQCDDVHFDKSLRDILEVLKLPGLDVEGVFTHFCVSDETAAEHTAFTNIQHDRFVRMIEAVESRGGFKFRIRHCCNSGGIANYSEWAEDMVRCGIILYGTDSLAKKMGLKPVMTLKTTVSTIKELTAGTSVSYGRGFFAARPSRIAVLPIGYADGLHRSLSGKLQVLTSCGRASQVGRICMDMCMIDVTDLPEIAVGDEVEIFGEHILCETNARLCGTISYELLCAISKRVPRYYYYKGELSGYDLRLLG
ncbi:alanine racemase [Oscillibacter sp. MSJ-2]|uniref:Alanine racemase n=2 Tax=Dysosmobacter acutus TaxID=2841504 RepID=A0ABS6F953_9FIRM|nr:alanine racemase [Dysosmobacter acutus]MBU5626824.1 alanine racemase [Dysosmobacter acutus]